MLGFPLGILSAAGGVGEVGDYELIETHILASAASEVVFSSLATHASTYKHLQIRYAARSARTDDPNDSIAVRLNGDTGSNYARHALLGFLSTMFSQNSVSASRMDIGFCSTNNQAASIFGGGVIDFLDTYSTTKNTTLRSLSGVAGASQPIILLSSGVHLNTAAISSITLFAGFSGANLVIGSRFSLYGIKG